MTRRYGRSDIRRDFKTAASRAVDSQWRHAEAQKQAAACEADPADVDGYDSACRFRDHPLHTCVTRDMDLIHPGQDCWYEARAQLAEQGADAALSEESCP